MGRKKNGRLLVVDVESTCWDGRPPDGQQSEIVQVGLSVLDVKLLRPIHDASILVRPSRSSVSEFCAQLTGISREDVESRGQPFAKACEMLLEQGSMDYPWASYGDYDREMFQRCCAASNVGYPFGKRHINVKTLLAMSLGWNDELGMDQALSRIGLPLEGKHHDAGDDAKNIAAIIRQILEATRAGLWWLDRVPS
jgi:inhibitor of KinA sporulation pathway (predicted exonuclease)